MKSSTKFRTLHEAIIFVLSDKKPLTFEEIAVYIEKQNLWRRKSDGNFPKSFQIKLRTTVSKKYKHFFVLVGNDSVQLMEIMK